jgi:hypothetical protein
MASIDLLLQAADFCEPELTDISDTTLWPPKTKQPLP